MYQNFSVELLNRVVEKIECALKVHIELLGFGIIDVDANVVYLRLKGVRNGFCSVHNVRYAQISDDVFIPGMFFTSQIKPTCEDLAWESYSVAYVLVQRVLIAPVELCWIRYDMYLFAFITNKYGNDILVK
jgi:hypothetical protein